MEARVMDVRRPLLAMLEMADSGKDIHILHNGQYYAEPLDPAYLDRFTLQVRVNSILGAKRWEDAARVIAMHDGCADDVRGAQQLVREVAVGARQ